MDALLAVALCTFYYVLVASHTAATNQKPFIQHGLVSMFYSVVVRREYVRHICLLNRGIYKETFFTLILFPHQTFHHPTFPTIINYQHAFNPIHESDRTILGLRCKHGKPSRSNWRRRCRRTKSRTSLGLGTLRPPFSPSSRRPSTSPQRAPRPTSRSPHRGRGLGSASPAI